MTRHEVHNKVKIWIDDMSEKPSTWHYGKMELHRDIDRIYDALNSQDCKQCKHHLSDNGNFPLSCSECSLFYGNKWESK
jgi:hypothetical protein